VDSIDADLFGTSIRGGGFQPSDESRHRTRAEVHSILIAAYNANLRDLEAHGAALNAAADTIMRTELLTGAVGCGVPALPDCVWVFGRPLSRRH
jgi:hypothetical protein